jgi:hypothetical protein
MSVAVPAAGEIFIFRTFKQHVNNQNDYFTNVWEFQAKDPAPNQSELVTLGNNLVVFEKSMTTDEILHDRFIVSEWTPTGDYDPYDMMSVSTGGSGALTTATNGLPLEACLFIRRSVATGRQGKLLLRGALTEADVESNAGDWILSDEAAMASDMNSRIASSGLSDYMGAPSASAGLQMVMHGVTKAGAVFTRPVIGMSVGGVSWAKMTRRWYNRAVTGR